MDKHFGPQFESRKIPQAPISHEDFIKFAGPYRAPEILAGVDHVEDDDHGFFILLEKLLPERANVDGVSLQTLYEKNVIEGGMTHERFRIYCHDHNLPHPVTRSGERSAYAEAIELAFNELIETQQSEYEAKASELGIDTSAGAIMNFTNSAGEVSSLQTSYEALPTTLDAD